MLKNSVFLITFLISFLLYSCENKPQVAAYDETFQSIFVSDEGHFRGIHIGDSKEKVKEKERGKLVEEQQNYLLFQDTLETGDKYDIAYYFDHSGVYTINFRGNFDEEEKSAQVFTNFHDYYTRLYGNPRVQDAYYTWKTSSEKSNHIEIALISHSTSLEAHGQVIGKEGGFISLSILNYDY